MPAPPWALLSRSWISTASGLSRMAPNGRFERRWQLSSPRAGSPASKCNLPFLYELPSRTQTGRNRMKLAIASTVALLLLFAAQTPASATSAQVLVQRQAVGQGASYGRQGEMAWRLGPSRLGLGWLRLPRLSALGRLLWLRLLSPGLWLLLSAISILGLGLRLGPSALAQALVTFGREKERTPYAAPAPRFCGRKRGDPALAARVATGPHFWHGPAANLARKCERSAADPSVAANELAAKGDHG